MPEKKRLTAELLPFLQSLSRSPGLQSQFVAGGAPFQYSALRLQQVEHLQHCCLQKDLAASENLIAGAAQH